MIEPDRSPIRRLLRRHPRRTAAVAGLMVLAGAAEGIGVLTLLPVLEIAGSGGEPGSVVSRALAGALGEVGIPASLGALFGVMVLALSLKAALRWIAMAEVGKAVAEVSAELRLRLLRAVLHAPWSHFTSEPAGRTANALSRDAFWAGSAYRAICATIAAGTQLLFYFAAVLIVSWKLGLLALAVGLAISVPLALLVRVSRRLGVSQTRRAADLVAHFVDVLHLIKPIRAMGREDAFLTGLSAEVGALRVEEERHVRTAEGLRALLEPVLGICVLAVLFLMLSQGGEEIPTILVVAVLLQRIAGRFQLLQTEYHEAVTASGAYSAVESQIEATESARDDRAGNLPAPAIVSGIQIDALEFHHGDAVVLDRVSLTIPAGAFVAIVGQSGAGKSTLLDLLAGLRLPTSGEIRVDGIPLTRIYPASWRKQLGYVPQESALLNGTVLANVLLEGFGADGDSGREAARRALLDAGAKEMVARLPRGLDEPVGERGLRLSGGERRRLALARALAMKPRLLILDEATAELDTESAVAIGRTLRELSGRTTIIIATHHPELAAFADEVYTLVDHRLERASKSPRTPLPAELLRATV